jgi:hypothetical protein
LLRKDGSNLFDSGSGGVVYRPNVIRPERPTEWKSRNEFGSMAGNGGHGSVRLDGGTSADVEAQRRILAISPQQHSLGYLGSS